MLHERRRQPNTNIRVASRASRRSRRWRQSNRTRTSLGARACLAHSSSLVVVDQEQPRAGETWRREPSLQSIARESNTIR